MNQRIYHHLAFLYGEEKAASLTVNLEEKLSKFAINHSQLFSSRPVQRLSEKDTVLITYGDMVQQKGQTPLQSLNRFLSATISGTVSTVHLLPFYPYSSDDGFSVIDYLKVDPELGDWQDIRRIGRSFRLMFDAVVNHISVQSDWFTKFQKGDPDYRRYFTVIKNNEGLEQVFRPRALPLLTEFETKRGIEKVWTTFSDDQVDLNYAEPKVLLEVIDTLLFYIAQGAEFIRLDAIAFIWKERGTSCIHLPQTHEIIRLMRTILDIVAPKVALITETNVPHQENITYFGNGKDEAQMVYNFSLPPLTLHTFHTGDATILTKWAQTLETPSSETTFFNFLASHDGIGLTPARDLLSEQEIRHMAERVRRAGGYISKRTNPDGSQSPYELNINFLDALGHTGDLEIVVRRFIAAQAIMLALRGVPGIYFHSLFGSRSWPEGVERTGRFRTINRRKMDAEPLIRELKDPATLRYHVFSRYRKLLQLRRGQPAFHPNAPQEVLNIHPTIFALKRTALDGQSTIYCIQHVRDAKLVVKIPTTENLFNLITENWFDSSHVEIKPYEVLWLKVQ